MTTEMWRNLIAIVLLVHGVGHSLGFWMPSSSWLLSSLLGNLTVRVINSLLWVLAAICFIAARLGVLGIRTSGIVADTGHRRSGGLSPRIAAFLEDMADLQHLGSSCC
jgi:hypothetical protein